MDEDRLKGIGNKIKGSVKETAGDLTGDAKLKNEGRGDKVKGEVQNTVGGAKDAVRDAVNKDKV